LHHALECGGEFGITQRVLREVRLPRRLRGNAARHGFAKVRECVGRNVECRFDGPTQTFSGEPDLVDTERRPVRGGRVLLVRATEADVGSHGNDRGPSRLCARDVERARNRV